MNGLIDPNAALQALLSASGSQSSPFGPTSRYHGLEIARWVRSDGTEVPYLRRRFIPPPEAHALLQEHTVAEGERLDLLAATLLGDAEQFWRICDANAALAPGELETPGRVGRGRQWRRRGVRRCWAASTSRS
jgi:hypothetical protein